MQGHNHTVLRLEYYNNILCVQAGWLIDEGIVSRSNYNNLKHRGWFKVERRASRGTPALVVYDSIPDRFKQAIIDKVGDPYKIRETPFLDYVKPDSKAMEFFSSYKIDAERLLPKDTVVEYVNNATVLNAVGVLVKKRISKRKSISGRKTDVWQTISNEVNNIKESYSHTLPANSRRLQDRYKKYSKEGYISLIHKGFKNKNSKVVSDKMEQLFVALACLPQRPYDTTVHDLYLKFLSGSLTVVDTETGEVYDRNDFFDEEGKPHVVSDTTISNYLKNPRNSVVIDKRHMGTMEFRGSSRPHVMRNAPKYVLSKISLDDRDLPRKAKDGTRPKAYYIYESKSTALIGYAHSKDKTTELFIDSLRNMFVFLKNNGLGVPMEPEVEHHIVNQFKDDLMKAGIIFPFVHWCLPGNSQEKYSERLIGLKKQGFEKLYQVGVGRFYNKRKADRKSTKKVFDEKNNTYKEPTYSYDKLIADDIETINEYNNSLHHDQKKYPGMTRMDVLLSEELRNPNLAEINEPLLARYIGYKVETSIRRNQYVRVMYQDYWLPNPNIIGALEANNYKVNAYYIPTPDDSIDSIFIYQNDRYLAECKLQQKFNTAKAEWTDEDDKAKLDQMKYITQFDSMVKELKPVKLAVIPEKKTEEVYEEAEIIPQEELAEKESNDFDIYDINEDDDDYYAQKALNDM